MKRRAFLAATGLTGLAIGASIMGGVTTTTTALELLDIEVPVPDLPAEFDGYTIGLVADTHLGHFVSTELVAYAAERLHGARCDLLALAGDYIWHPDDEKIWPRTNSDFRGLTHTEVPVAVFERIAEIFTQHSPTDGVVAVLGNHDGWIDPAACRQIFSRRGIEVIENRSTVIRRGDAALQVAGVADLWTGFPALPHLPPRSPRSATVLVSHNPDYVAERLQDAQFSATLALCGHTHGGQIRLPLGGIVFDNVDDKRFVNGLVRAGDTFVYTTKGVGVVEIPLRLNCPPDVSRLILRRSNS